MKDDNNMVKKGMTYTEQPQINRNKDWFVSTK